jgi:hypothetical protein
LFKPVWARFFPVWLGLTRFFLVFSVWVRFGFSVWVRFGFLEQKPVQTGLGSVFFGLSSVQFCFFGLSLVQFSFFDLGSVWFFRFQAYKTETELIGVFKILIGFFHGLVFLVIFFQFFKFNRFFGFFTHFLFLPY